jgi:hypothetical protein
LGRELLILLNCLLVAILFFPPLLRLAVYICDGTTSEALGATYWYFFFALFTHKSPFWLQNGTIEWQAVTPGNRLFLWAIVLGPYVVYQFARSIIWAVKALHAR